MNELKYKIAVIHSMIDRISDGTNNHAKLTIGSGVNTLSLDAEALQCLIQHYKSQEENQ